MIKVSTKNFDLSKAVDRHKAALGMYADTAAKKIKGEAKAKAPWQDRTGNARESIDGTGGWEGNELKVVLSGGMSYSVYLELAYERRYAILKPTIDKNASEILNSYQKLVKD